MATKKKPAAAKKAPSKVVQQDHTRAKYPRHSLRAALRIPRALLDQNAGKECTDSEAASFTGLGFHGPFKVELSSALKYGYLERPRPGVVALTPLARRILRPQSAGDELAGLREAVLNAPEISAVYKHYRGENLPDATFLANALTDKFGIPQDGVSEFLTIFSQTLNDAALLEEHGGKERVVDISASDSSAAVAPEALRKMGREVDIVATDSCFVVMPFAKPIGDHYSAIFEPAIKKAGLKPIRADNEIFGTGKIMDQIWSGITTARVLVAELTGRNANVFYELGLAHALQKPVVLVSSNEGDVPFDLQHIRVIYYDVNDPFWGEKLIAKISENIVSALKDPSEATFKGST